MDLKRLADKAKRAIDDRGGTERLKQDADRLRDIASGPGTAKEKAKAAGDALKEPARPADPHAPGDSERREPPVGDERRDPPPPAGGTAPAG